MALSENQVKALKAKLNYRHVRTRLSQGTTLSFVEGWHVIAEANRIFGFENWDRQTQAPECFFTESQGGQVVAFYSTKVRVTVRSGETVTIREGIGTGVGRSQRAEIAHELAVKAAETDATKRALATFGNPFGLALYDRELSHVSRPRDANRALTLILADGRTLTVPTQAAFAEAIRRELGEIETLEAAYEFWTQNLTVFTDLSRTTQGADVVTTLVGALKERLHSIAEVRPHDETVHASDNSAFLIPKEKRLRDRDHLAFVASQPCLVCGRRPAQAHHLKFAQARSLSMKVSDEFTVPLCNTHHDQLHRAGDERAWWARNGIIEPLKFAERLWAASRQSTRESFQLTPEAKGAPKSRLGPNGKEADHGS
jgi:DNA recombination protein Rad52